MSSNKQAQPSAPAQPVVIVAVPVESTPTITSTVHVEAVPSREPRTELERLGLENEYVGICRRCRKQFVRPHGVHDGSAEYYRCQECVGLRPEDVFNSFCTIQ